jgi:predicted aconitase with swiveling domain
MEKILQGRSIVEGDIEWEALVTKDAISFMGTVNPKTGFIIERKHEIEGACIKGKILVYPCGKGSTGGSYMLYDVVKNGCGPLAIINQEAEAVSVIGAIVADLPMIDQIDITNISTGDFVKIDMQGRVVVTQR